VGKIIREFKCLEVKTLAKDVLCEVKNCTYWGQGNTCTADAIYVVSHHGEKASNSKETDCKTFEPADQM
jgi:hypothetical protein